MKWTIYTTRHIIVDLDKTTRKTLFHGVTRKGRHVILDSIKQVEVEHHEDQLKFCGTVKAAVLEEDPGFPVKKPVN